MEVAPDRHHDHDNSFVRKPVLDGKLGLVMEEPLKCCGFWKKKLAYEKDAVREPFLN